MLGSLIFTQIVNEISTMPQQTKNGIILSTWVTNVVERKTLCGTIHEYSPTYIKSFSHLL